MLDDIKKTHWATADKLRNNMDAAEYKLLDDFVGFKIPVHLPSLLPKAVASHNDF